MTGPDPGKETRIIELKGRQLVIKSLNDAQIALMAREAKILQGNAEGDRKFTGVTRMFNLLESMVVQEEDKEYLNDLIVSGDVELKDLTDFIAAFKPEDEKPTVRRGRPPRARV